MSVIAKYILHLYPSVTHLSLADVQQLSSGPAMALVAHPAVGEYHLLLSDMKGQNFDVIRFASYRTACKLRFIQKKTNFHIVDIWNVIESFRENGLKAAEPRGAEVFPARLEQLVGSIYVQLNKRLPPGQQIDPVRATSTMLAWLRAAYDPEDSGRMRVLSIKVGLALMCAGKLTDKLRCEFFLFI
ncbi:DTNA [Cordylochernes scorpioides]|uniref:DTNA n=1 Tax=Cordylochernes scorpioides TaxID=51811 RepID=A0ABY6K2K8_9ARAC|nr:DTNA [Cordylochernes scorpioides]